MKLSGIGVNWRAVSLIVTEERGMMAGWQGRPKPPQTIAAKYARASSASRAICRCSSSTLSKLRSGR